LQQSVPAADDASGRFQGFTRWDAAAMSEAHPGSPIRYVPADVASSGPTVVSVHVIDDSTWGGAALSSDGRCYVMVVSVDDSDTRYGYTSFGILPKGSPCLGSAASTATATASSWPAA
jgi:hypothetical protein